MFSSKKRIAVAVLILLAVGGYFVWKARSHANTSTRYIIGRVQKGTLVVSVSGTGQIAAASQVTLHPMVSGTVSDVRVQNGDYVYEGDTLAVLDAAGAKAALDQSKASENAAEVALQNSKDNLEVVTHQQVTLVQNAYMAYANTSLTAIPTAANTSATIPTISGTYNGDPGSYTIIITGFSASGQGNAFTVSGLERGGGSVLGTGPVPLGTHGLFIQFPTASVSIGDSWTVNIPNTAASSYVANKNAYNAALETQTAALATAKASIASNQAALQTAKAALESADYTYSNNFISAPFSGTIGQWNIQKGDQVSSVTNIGVLATQDKMAQISLSEVDAAKVALGQRATLTLDAIPGLALTGKVVSIDSVGTVTQGVVTYNAKISLDAQDSRVRPGMTVNAIISVTSKADVLMLPNSAVKQQSGTVYVEIPSSGTAASSQGISLTSTPERVMIKVGISSDQNTEIISGLTEGQTVVVRTIQSSNASPSPQSPFIRAGGGGGGGR